MTVLFLWRKQKNIRQGNLSSDHKLYPIDAHCASAFAHQPQANVLVRVTSCLNSWLSHGSPNALAPLCLLLDGCGIMPHLCGARVEFRVRYPMRRYNIRGKFLGPMFGRQRPKLCTNCFAALFALTTAHPCAAPPIRGASIQPIGVGPKIFPPFRDALGGGGSH
jgi:hypothetical protein